MNQQDQKIQDLERKNEELNKKLEDFSNKLSLVEKNKDFQLSFPLDTQSKKIIRDALSEEILDIVWNDYFYYSSTFESIDRYLTAGTGASELVNSEGVYLATNGTGSNEAGLLLQVSSDLISVQHEARFKVSNKVSSITNVNWAAFTLEDDLGSSYVGFWMKSGTIYGATSKTGTETLVNLGSYSANTFYKLELHFTPNKVTFFVNDIEKGVSITNIPTATPTRLFDFGIGETSASARNSTTSYFNFIQKKQ